MNTPIYNQQYKNIMNWKVFISLSLITIAGLTSFCSQDNIFTKNEDNISGTNLPAVEINGDNYSPNEGVSISFAKTNIITELIKEGVKGDINSSLKLTEITTKEAWKNARVQIYRVSLDYAWLDGVALIKNKKVLTILKGMPIKSIFLADLDMDGIYEIYTNYYLGSGIISKEISGYNISLNENYKLAMRMENDLELFIDNGILKATVKPYNKENENPIIKKVNLIKTKNKHELIID